MRAAVVGAGIFGCLAALDLAAEGWQVDLFDARHEVMMGASGANQGRLHAGYHYPRSLATAREVRDAGPELAARFPQVVVSSFRHHYLVAKGSLTSGEKYLAFLDELQLPYRTVEHPLVRSDTVELALRVQGEAFLDLVELRWVLHQQLVAAGVKLRLRTPATARLVAWDFDVAVDATYGRSGSRPLRYELTEIALVRLGAQFKDLSFVVMDGPYVSLDPLARTDLHMLYDVVHSVHHVTDDLGDVPRDYWPLIDQGRTHNGPTRVDLMQGSVRRFLNGIGMPEYKGSLFTLRAVLPDVDDTDARPTLVERDGNVVSVLSGKIATAVSAARRVVELAGEVAG